MTTAHADVDADGDAGTETSTPEMDRITIDPAEPTTDGDNPNQMGERQFEALKDNITEYGFLVPIILNKDHVVADGEHRLQAARELALDEIPAVVVDVDDADRRVIRQVMNKLKGDHDIHQDATEFQKILKDRHQQKEDLAHLLGQSENSIDGVLELIEDDQSDVKDTLNEVTAENDGPTDIDTSTDTDSDTGGGSSSTTDGTDDRDNDSLGSPDALDPDAMEFDHECPECGYQW